MGIIRAAVKSISSGLGRSVVRSNRTGRYGRADIDDTGRLMNKKSQNRKGSRNVISDGSVIHVYDNQFMILTDGGKIIDYTAEPGYFEVKNDMDLLCLTEIFPVPWRLHLSVSNTADSLRQNRKYII